MVLVVVLIRSGSRVLKTWFGCQVAEQGTLLDLFNDFSVSVGEAVYTLGNYIEYNVHAQEDFISPSLPVSVLPNAFTILMQGARNRTVLLDKWNNT